MEIRPYQVSDRDACLRLFDSNGPGYFAPDERDGLAKFLASPPGSYYVMENDGELLGCGGFTPGEEPGSVTLTWGMVRGDLHRQGLGRFLLFYRLKAIGQLAGVSLVRLKTTPGVAGFFEKAGGFRIDGIEPNGFGPGLDKVSMVKRLVVCA